MSPPSRRPLTPRAKIGLLTLITLGSGIAGYTAVVAEQAYQADAAAPNTIDALPDRFVQIILPTQEESAATAPAPTARDNRAAAKIGLKDAKQDPRPTTVEQKSKLLAGVIGTRGESGGVIGSGGLGARGAGLGGGGSTSDGLGAFGRGSRSVSTVEHQASGGETFQDYGVNPMTLSTDDGMSTFAMDVDTASYTMARAALNAGRLPAKASVRVEEFVNYLEYDYVPPTTDAPFAVHMEATQNPWQPSHHVLRIGVQGWEVPEDQRKPVRLTFLVDVSGSMGARNKLPLATESIDWLVDQLGDADTIAITTYAGRTEVLLPPTNATDRSTIDAALERLRPGGGTNMDAGIDLAYQAASDAYVDGAENRVIILSDGDANIGRTSHEQLLETIESHAEAGITLTTLGFGSGQYNDVIMEQLANKGDGNYYFIDSMDESERIFGEKLGGTIQTIAKDAKIQVHFNPDAVLGYRLIGYENRDIADEDFRNDAVDAGELGSGHQVTALYDVILADGWQDAPDRTLAEVRLRARPPGPDAPASEWSTHFPARLVHSSYADASRDLRIAFGTAVFAEKLRGSPFTEEVRYDEIAALIYDARRDRASDHELWQLVAKAGELRGEDASYAALD